MIFWRLPVLQQHDPGFNQTNRSYDSNVVVYAVPAEFVSEYLWYV